MEECFDPTPAAQSDAPLGRILIVDDDPVVAGMLGASLAVAGYEVVEVISGEDALSQLHELSGTPLPDIIFLDIEMGEGIDGYEICRRLRINDRTRHLPVIFLSSHDGLHDRLQAYDAGGEDFIAKPFMPDEVVRKASVAIRHKRKQEVAGVEKHSNFETAMTALTSLGESGVTLKFSRGAHGCSTLRALAVLAIKSIGSFGLDCHVQLRTSGEVLTQTAHGPASPLEESVIERSKTMGRIFGFGTRLIVNYDSVSMLILNMPISDADLCGRIRDEVAIMAETAELAVANINLRSETIKRANELRNLSDISRNAVVNLRGGFREQQVSTRVELENLAHTIEGMYVYLGLTNQQEFTISDTVRLAVDRVLTLFENSGNLDQSFAGIVDGLTKASECTVTQEEEEPLSVELW